MAALDGWLVFEDEASFPGDAADHPRPVTPRPRPVIRIGGSSRRRLTVAALTCYKQGESSD